MLKPDALRDSAAATHADAEAAEGAMPSVVHWLAEDFADSASFAHLKAYWDAKRGGRRMPLRTDIDPLELRDHLGWLSLIEVMPKDGDYRFRLIGSNVAEIYGRNITGQTVSQLAACEGEEYWGRVRRRYDTVVREAAIVRSSGSLHVVDKPFLHFTAVYFPLDRGDGSVGTILAEFRIV